MTLHDAQQLESAGLLPNGVHLYQRWKAGYWPEEDATLYGEALAAVESRPGVGHRDKAALHHLMAEFEQALGNFSSAESHARAAVVFRQSVLGPDHVAVAADRVLLGFLLGRRADYDLAEPLLRSALDTYDATLGTDSHESACCAHHLAAVLAGLQQFDEADALYRRSVYGKRKSLGPDHPDIAITLHDWALLCETIGESDRAMGIWAEAEALMLGNQVLPRHGAQGQSQIGDVGG